MILDIKRKSVQIAGIFVLITIAIPSLVIFYKVITSEEDSVVIFMDPYSIVDLIVMAYYLAIIIAIPVYGIVWLVNRVRGLLSLKNEQKKLELLHLQSQVNPHFFFNTLNNLYGLVDKDTHRAKQLILKLSDMMRYSIYDGQKQTVTVVEEEAYLRNYVELHTGRYHKKVDVSFHAEIEDSQLKVLPLMFIILVENAFKHGVEHLRSDAFVYIYLQAEKEKITFEVENNFDAEEVLQNKGIGLENLKRRLAIAYPNRHSLSVSQKNDVYKVKLTLSAL
ncbi:MAG: histidine kinase [Thalassobius sp.]|nr:histidine kinase [Thalassovita sp.]